MRVLDARFCGLEIVPYPIHVRCLGHISASAKCTVVNASSRDAGGVETLGTRWTGCSRAAISILFVIALGGCSKTQRISVLANRWETGQHKTCTFLVPTNVVCDAPDAPVTHWDAVGMQIETSKSIVVERGDYNASFSSATPDYSVWDCHKTGGNNVAIDCAAVHKLTENEAKEFRTWDATQEQTTRSLADLKTEMDAAKPDIRNCNFSSSDPMGCVDSAVAGEKPTWDAIKRKRQDAIDAANSEGGKVGRTFNPR
jgi:hypothetical protein